MTNSRKPILSYSPSETLEFLQDSYFPPYISTAHLFHAPAGWGFKDRVFYQYQLQYTVSGAADYEIEGRLYRTGSGDLLLHRPGERHSASTIPKQPYVCISVLFHFSDSRFPFDEIITDANYLGNYQNQEIDKQLTQLIVACKQPGAVNQLRAQTLLLSILLGINASLRDIRDSRSTSTQKVNIAKMALVKNYILEHYQEPVSIKHLERITGLSRDYIISQFKGAYGLTPIQYLIHVRVEKAKELALQEGLSVSEIAERVGYTDVHSFGKMFKKKTGTSLTQFCKALFSHRIKP